MRGAASTIAAIGGALALLVASTGEAQSPIEEGYDSDLNALICDMARDWKALMRRDYPDVDRSMPSVERPCHMPRETLG